MSLYPIRLVALCLAIILPAVAKAAQDAQQTQTPSPMGSGAQTAPMQTPAPAPTGSSAQPAPMQTPAPTESGSQPAPTQMPMQAPSPMGSGAQATPTQTATTKPSPAPSLLPAPPFTVSAKRVTFYSDRYVVTADDNVIVVLSDGTRISGNTFSMDLKLNRFLIAGNVRVKTKDGQNIAGAAFAEFFDSRRAYFVPIIEEPDRWTFVNNDFNRPLRGREMPGDTFFLPDLGTEHVFLYGSKALIAPRRSVRFTPAMINLNFLTDKLPAYVPAPTYFFSFSPNPNFAQNGLSGAYFDAPYPFAGGEHGSAALHLRYDEINKFYLAYEQHLAITDRSYVVFSANPITRPQKFYNLLAMDHLSPKVQVELFVQEAAFQHDFSQPLSAGAFANLRVTAGLRQSFLQLTGDEYWESLLANPGCVTLPGYPCLQYYGDPSHNWVPDHNSDTQLSWTGFEHRVYRSVPLNFRLRSGAGLIHPYTPSIFNGGEYPTTWQHFTGFTLYTSALRLNMKPLRAWSFNAVYDRQRQWYSLPHHVDTANTTLSLSRTFDKHFSTFVSYSIANVGDYYGVQQSLAYPSQVPVSPITGQSYPGYAAFNGFGTTRSLSETAIWTPSSAMTLNLTWRENHDFPGPIPYMPSVLGFGQSPSYNEQGDIGVSPQQLTADLRLRFRPNLLVDLSRSYYFNWGNRAWSPQFSILITK